MNDSVICVLANAIHLFLPPWFVFPVVGWAIGTWGVWTSWGSAAQSGLTM